MCLDIPSDEVYSKEKDVCLKYNVHLTGLRSMSFYPVHYIVCRICIKSSSNLMLTSASPEGMIASRKNDGCTLGSCSLASSTALT